MKFSLKNTRRILLVGVVIVVLFILYTVISNNYKMMEGVDKSELEKCNNRNDEINRLKELQKNPKTNPTDKNKISTELKRLGEIKECK